MFISPVKEIDSLRMSVLKNRVRSCKSIIVSGGMTVVNLGDGKWWSSWLGWNNGAYLPGGHYHATQTLLRCLEKLGVVSKAAVDKHLAICKSEYDRINKQHDIRTLHRLAKDLGFNLTKKRLKTNK